MLVVSWLGFCMGFKAEHVLASATASFIASDPKATLSFKTRDQDLCKRSFRRGRAVDFSRPVTRAAAAGQHSRAASAAFKPH